MVKKYFSALLLTMLVVMSSAEQLYVNVRTGNDTNPGTKSQPLKTLQEAAKRVNANKQQEAIPMSSSVTFYIQKSSANNINSVFTWPKMTIW